MKKLSENAFSPLSIIANTAHAVKCFYLTEDVSGIFLMPHPEEDLLLLPTCTMSDTLRQQ